MKHHDTRFVVGYDYIHIKNIQSPFARRLFGSVMQQIFRQRYFYNDRKQFM